MFYSSLFSHDSQFAACRLRKKYNQQIAVRTFCEDKTPNEIGKSSFVDGLCCR